MKQGFQAALVVTALLLAFVGAGTVLYRMVGPKVLHYQTHGQENKDFLGDWQCRERALDIAIALGDPRGLKVRGLAPGKDVPFDRFDAKAPFVEENAAGTPRQLYFRGNRLVLMLVGEDGKSEELFFESRDPA